MIPGLNEKVKLRLRQAVWAPAVEPEHSLESSFEKGENEVPFTPGWRFFTSLSTFMAMQLLAAIDSTAIGTIMTTMTTELHGSTSEAEWIANAYMLTCCAFQLPVSALSEIFGRKCLVYTTLGLFMLGSLITAVAQNMAMVIAGRTIQGLGAAGSLVLPEVFVADVVPLRLRGLYYSYLVSIWAVGAALGPIMGGGFAEYVTWRWLFYINLPICGTALLMTPFGLRLKPVSATWREQLRDIDFTGAYIVVASATSLLLAMSMGGAMYEWSSWHVLLPLILGFAGFVAVGFYEARYPVQPIFNPRVLANSSAILSFVQNTLQGIVAMAVSYYLPVLFEGVLGFGPLVTGVALLPVNLIGPPASLVAGLFIVHTGHYHLLTLLSWVIAVLGCGLLLLMNGNTTVAQLIFLQVPVAVGIGVLYSTLSTAVIATNDAPEWIDAAAFMSFCRSLGDALGTAIAGSVFASEMRNRLAGLSGLNIEVKEALSLVAYVEQLPSGQTKTQLQNAIVDSVHAIFIVLCVVSGVALMTCIFIKEFTLDRNSEARQGIDE